MNLQPVYLIAVFISLGTLIIFYEINANKINKNYLMMFLTTLISNFGYAMSVYSETLEAAMAGNLVSYIGSIFAILFMFVVVGLWSWSICAAKGFSFRCVFSFWPTQ